MSYLPSLLTTGLVGSSQPPSGSSAKLGELPLRPATRLWRQARAARPEPSVTCQTPTADSETKAKRPTGPRATNAVNPAEKALSLSLVHLTLTLTRGGRECGRSPR